MNHLTLLHNGDPRNGSPHWLIKIYENGEIRGEILTKTAGRFLPSEFKLDNHQRFFKIPPPLLPRYLITHPHHEEIIVYLSGSSGKQLCSFLLSEVPKGTDLHQAIGELVQKISELVDPA